MLAVTPAAHLSSQMSAGEPYYLAGRNFVHFFSHGDVSGVHASHVIDDILRNTSLEGNNVHFLTSTSETSLFTTRVSSIGKKKVQTKEKRKRKKMKRKAQMIKEKKENQTH